MEPKGTDVRQQATENLIFIIGLTQRVGTNFLLHALAQNSSCTVPKTLHEDNLIREMPSLQRYSDDVSRRWNPKWGAKERTPELKSRLVDAVLQFVLSDAKDTEKRLIMKTPSIFGIECLPDMMPNGKFLILVRNGPDVIESGMRSFNWRFEDACKHYRDAAQHLLEQKQHNSEFFQQQTKIIRYEDLLNDTENQMKTILDFLNLQDEDFDAQAIRDLPVYGSSELRGASSSVHWEPVEKSDDFDPLKRSAKWRKEALERYEWLTNYVARELGYPPVSTLHLPMHRKMFHKFRDHKDVLPWRIRVRLRYDPAV